MNAISISRFEAEHNCKLCACAFVGFAQTHCLSGGVQSARGDQSAVHLNQCKSVRDSPIEVALGSIG